MFFRGYTLSTDRVRDRVRVREGGRTLVLTVSGEASRLVQAVSKVQEKLTAARAEDAGECAEMFAEAVFGKEQAAKLLEFYGNDPYCVLEVCGKYFRNRLGGLITRKQMKMG